MNRSRTSLGTLATLSLVVALVAACSTTESKERAFIEREIEQGLEDGFGGMEAWGFGEAEARCVMTDLVAQYDLDRLDTAILEDFEDLEDRVVGESFLRSMAACSNLKTVVLGSLAEDETPEWFGECLVADATDDDLVEILEFFIWEVNDDASATPPASLTACTIEAWIQAELATDSGGLAAFGLDESEIRCAITSLASQFEIERIQTAFEEDFPSTDRAIGEATFRSIGECTDMREFFLNTLTSNSDIPPAVARCAVDRMAESAITDYLSLMVWVDDMGEETQAAIQEPLRLAFEACR